MTTPRLGEIVAALGGQLLGDPDATIHAIRPLAHAGPGSISFLAQARLRAQLEATGASAVIVTPALAEHAPAGCHRVLTDDPYLYFARLTQWWARQVRPSPVVGIHPSAVVDASAVIGQGHCISVPRLGPIGQKPAWRMTSSTSISTVLWTILPPSRRWISP